MSLPIQLHEEGNQGFFSYEDQGTILAKMIFRRENQERVVIEHTEVDSSLQGKGVGKLLLTELLKWAEESGSQVEAECPYARGQLTK